MVHLDTGERHVVCTDDNHGHMTWIGDKDCEIIVEFFHGVTDGIGMLLALINYVLMSFYQSTRKVSVATMICVLQSLVYILLLAVILIRPFAQNGVWIVFLGAEILTILTTVLVTIAYGKKIPWKLKDFMRMKEDIYKRTLELNNLIIVINKS